MGLRLILFALLGSALMAGLTTIMKDGHGEMWLSLVKRIGKGSESPQAIAALKLALLDHSNAVRYATETRLLDLDNELETWIEQEITAGLNVEQLEALAQRIQTNWPRYKGLNIATATAPSLSELRNHLLENVEAQKPEMTHMACVVLPIMGGISHRAVLVTGQRLHDFSPEKLHQTSDVAFFNTCPHCKAQHISRAERQKESFSLECPSCNLTYALVASDTRGRFHYANEFLTGYQPPAIYPQGQSRIEQLFTIWGAVHQNCRYTQDPVENLNRTDRWQTAMETQIRGEGDCEDSAIYLADWLLARGYDARVALGRYGDIGGHAWCVVRLDNVEYLLETTSEGNPDFDLPPLISRVGSRYIPEILFDRWSIYVRATRHQLWNGNYWEERSWTRLEPRSKKPLATTQHSNPKRSQFSKIYTSQGHLLDPTDMAFVKSLGIQAATFFRLQSIAPSSQLWKEQPPKSFWPNPAP
jgi:predicted transglutaminase-like cysteine proteinase